MGLFGPRKWLPGGREYDEQDIDFYPQATRRRSGFEDAPSKKSCGEYHNPPTHLYIPEGKIYRHVCPCCGKETIMHSNATTATPLKPS